VSTLRDNLGLAAVPVTVDRLSVRFGSFTAVDDISLSVGAGEIVALLGPSGCGKTTLLKALSGLQPLESGRIRFGEDDVTARAPHRRDVGMVFQNYALFPHMTAAENVEFGLAMHDVPRIERARRAAEVLALLQIDEIAAKYPAQMSGGQQQRVAVARTLVVKPKVLLLDEPLSALDRQLRDVMRAELRRLLKTVGITCVIVTHDQDEALTLADRVAVMRAGRIEQVGTPREVYASPRTRFVASFIGQTNYFDGKVVSVSGETARVRLDEANEITARALRPVTAEEPVEVAIRPEAFALAPMPGAQPLAAEFTGETYAGGVTEWHFRLAGGQTFTVVATDTARPEDPASPHLMPQRAVILAEK
jgi:spermidine/putrescine ABC transporter ATP-binding subunit